jgi:uncharacterized membrane protein YvbJ
MQCNFCGTQNPEDAVYCNKCGKKIAGDSTTKAYLSLLGMVVGTAMFVMSLIIDSGLATVLLILGSLVPLIFSIVIGFISLRQSSHKRIFAKVGIIISIISTVVVASFISFLMIGLTLIPV